MKKSTNAMGSKAKTAAKMKQIDWKRAVTIGVDLGDRFSHYCALDADGTVVDEGREQREEASRRCRRTQAGRAAPSPLANREVYEPLYNAGEQTAAA